MSNLSLRSKYGSVKVTGTDTTVANGLIIKVLEDAVFSSISEDGITNPLAFHGISGSQSAGEEIYAKTKFTGVQLASGVVCVGGAAIKSTAPDLSLLTPGQGTFAVDTESWIAYAANTIARVIEDAVSSLKITYVDNTRGAYMIFKAAADLTSDLTIGKDYTFKIRAKINVGSAWMDLYNGSAYTAFNELTTSFAEYEYTFTAQNATTCMTRMKNMGAGEIVYVDWWDLIEA